MSGGNSTALERAAVHLCAVCLSGHDKITFERQQLIEMNSSSRLRLVASSIKIRTYVREYPSVAASLSLFLPLPSLSLSLAFFFCACFCRFQCYLQQTMRKNLRICFEARKIIKNNPFAFFSHPPSTPLSLRRFVWGWLSYGCHCRLSEHRLAKLVDCFRYRFKQLPDVYVIFVYVHNVYVLQLFRCGNLYAS